MTPSGPKKNEDSLPTPQKMKFVPMTAEQFQRQRMKKIAMGAGITVAVIALVALAMYKSSAPAAARNDYDEAVRVYNAGKYREAVQLLDNAISGKANLADAYQLRGNIHRILNEPQKSIDDLTKVIDMRPDGADNYRVRAQCYRDVGQSQRALADYEMLIKLQPSAAAYNGRGVCYRDLGQPMKALEDFSKAVELEPTVDNLLQRGMAYEAMGDHVKAIQDFDRVIELRPDMPYTYRARAYARDATGDRAGAVADREKARSIEYPSRTPSKALAKNAKS